ncbi:carbon-nitrogen hydrolase family protein [Hydrogenophaga sp. PBL-H3]|uniref:carbon-nitrogen hydrolase family protein n=1 Tax=Hydrogenophaga sp. PBL-H3 TaxID=434010 RepID=UPI0013201F6D|nr:carbon-nitrogen hydrolase family protein [Hydrogenophaga sp. PBL-H3]QHE74933.1 carbon-nitrogen hydrolase family protein [Hydrogenophaga sp. PBL-H3]QHE79360.1 carbon-nitrogen hydrolase family protein [Hydrogenophaga sp. PBL-H3]
MTADTLSLALWQCPYAGRSSEALVRLDATAAQARAQGAGLLVCPEMSLTGYQIGAAQVAELAEPADGALAQAVGAIAQRHGIAIVYGYPEHHAGSKPYNAAQFISADGQRVANYRKTHLFGDIDRAQFSPGPQAPAVFGWNGWRLGLLICYDIEFPEPARGLALQGADAILVPTANMVAFDEVQRVLLPARALENRVYVAYANACGQEGDTAYGGLSTVCGPLGDAGHSAGRDEALLLVTLEPSALQRARVGAQWPDRRPALYAPGRG